MKSSVVPGYLLLLLSGLALSACTSVAPQPAQWPYPEPPMAPAPGTEVQPGSPMPGQPPPIPATPLPPEIKPPLLELPRSIEASGVTAPVLSLVKKAREAKKAGRFDEASASLERALRIEPRNPWVWQSLAAVHLAQKQGEQAESEAKKSTSLARRNPYIEVENWRLIAAARNLRGDSNGLLQAQLRYEELQRQLTQPPLKSAGGE